MKKFLSLCLVFLCISMASFSQEKFAGFFKPTTSNPTLLTRLQAADSKGVWVAHPAVTLTAAKFTLTGDERVFDVTSLTSAGVGLTYEHFIELEGKPYNNFSVNAIVLTSLNPGGSTSVSLSPVVSVTAFQVLNAGVGYDFTLKKPFLLTGILYSFN